MQISNISKQNFGLRLGPAIKKELCTVYKKLNKHNDGFQPEFLDQACETFLAVKPEGILDFAVASRKSFLGTRTEKQCWLELPNGNRLLFWNKLSGLFSKHKKHLTAEDISEIIFQIPEKIKDLKLKA